MARVDMASLYRAVKREPKEGTIGEAIKCHAQACGFVAYIADVHPDEVARVVAGAKFADRLLARASAAPSTSKEGE